MKPHPSLTAAQESTIIRIAIGIDFVRLFKKNAMETDCCKTAKWKSVRVSQPIYFETDTDSDSDSDLDKI